MDQGPRRHRQSNRQVSPEPNTQPQPPETMTHHPFNILFPVSASLLDALANLPPRERARCRRRDASKSRRRGR